MDKTNFLTLEKKPSNIEHPNTKLQYDSSFLTPLCSNGREITRNKEGIHVFYISFIRTLILTSETIIEWIYSV